MNTERKEIGKIKGVCFGMGGYQDAMFGVSFHLGGKPWGVNDFWGTWARRPEGAKWTVEDQGKEWLKMCQRVIALLEDAGRHSLDKLEGTPIEATFDGMTLKSWRILTEAL